MEELAARKEKTTDALKPQIDEWLKEYQDEIDFYNNQIKKVVKSKDPSGISEEIWPVKIIAGSLIDFFEGFWKYWRVCA